MGKIIKIKVYFSGLFLFLGIIVFAQNFNVGFDVKFRSKLQDNIEISEKFNLNIDGETKESFFKSNDLLKSDFNANIYKNFASKVFTKYEMILYKFYKSEFIPPNNWKLLEGSKKILELNCKKASLSFGGRKWIAWYSTEIPFQDGPYKFSGLPGLILEINSTDNDYQFTAVTIEKKTDEIKIMHAISMGDKLKEIRFKENIISEPASQYKQNLMQNNLKMTVTFNGKLSDQKEIAETINQNFWEWMKSHDNPIEKGDLWIK